MAQRDDVFEALQVGAGDHRLKADLVVTLHRLLRAEGLSQAEAAKRLKIAQPELANLLRRRFRGFSVERLMRLLTALGQDVQIRVKPHTDPATPARVRLIDEGETA